MKKIIILFFFSIYLFEFTLFLCFRLFLAGLQKYGRGHWKEISRHFVVSKTHTQIASHAQKFFLHQNITNKKKKTRSIHEITLNPPNNEEEDFHEWMNDFFKKNKNEQYYEFIKNLL